VSVREIKSRDSILAAISEHDQLGRAEFLAKYGFGEAKRYFVVANGKRYDSKAIAGAAHGFEFPDRGPLRSNEFTGGEASVARKLRELGFDVEVLDRPDRGSPIRDGLQGILQGYAQARTEQFGKSHPMSGRFQRVKAALESSDPIRTRETLRVVASPGLGNWAKVPWISILDSRETTSNQRGVSCVFLFREDLQGVYLTFNQGVAKLKKELGVAEARRALRDRAKVLRDRFPELEDSGFTLDDRVDLAATPGLGADYEVSTIAYKLYPAGAIPRDDEVEDDLEALLSVYEEYVQDPREERPRPPGGVQVDLASITQNFGDALIEAHISFGPSHDRLVRAFVAALATKRFVILTGLSGSGKTQLALRFGEWLGVGRSHIEPVRPDWTGSEALFGFEDALQPAVAGQRAWQVPRVLEFMLRAARDPQSPHLLILDEMNLAHVERYFADVLSGMESDYPVLPNLHLEQEGNWRMAPSSDPQIMVPRNLFVVGTVNVDETTYMFSPKVLDRANVFEFRVATEELQSEYRKPVECSPGDDGLVQKFLAIATDDSWHLDHPAMHASAFRDHLRVIHELLSRTGFEFGHRVFYEAVRFAAIYAGTGDSDLLRALDLQILQKVLPRLHGSRRRLESTLCSLAEYCFTTSSHAEAPEAQATFDPLTPPPGVAQLPLSFEKLQRMTRSLRANQFASFSE